VHEFFELSSYLFGLRVSSGLWQYPLL
jgi:hypothetical protein